MSAKNNEIRSKLALLQLATELGSISKACEIMGYSRDSYYRFKKQYEAVGERGLKNLSRKKPAIKNRVSQEVEEQVIEIALDYPNYGQAKVAELLTARGCCISASGVRTIWLRHNLETKKNRLLALHTKLQQDQLLKPNEHHIEQIYKLAPNDSNFECLYPGDICVQDTYDLGVITPLGQLYLHSFVDGYSQYTIAVVMEDNSSAAVVTFLKEFVLPWYHDNNIEINSILTDRGTEFSERKSPEYSLALIDNRINHIQMRAYNGPVVNGLAARFQTFSYNEFFEPYLKSHNVASLAQLNDEFGRWLSNYNQQQPLAGRYTLGKTAAEVLRLSRHLISHHQATND
ncbi:helix-turn-helix domain-containing protein [Shewanella schlegeliana]|uniref:Transposase n=1 Tax=Shewanella schlegeliana TaxID=190308 RepID=A0ABS1T4X5_9GAMM|nr:helix-turn-helix domain-containing protein [Shewanella schlegeliana]MBL4914556.1 transposase [Shewanella schlegeliana]MCL1109628.1 helix-turn-helix domain-containing protein [Shewanella schlegeliana]GIU29997.1 IS481 family transposase [Shewanella schlegeliana]